MSRWGISDDHGDAARALIDTYVEGMTNDGANRPPPFDRPRESIHSDVVRVVAERFAHLAHTEGILVCWACAIPVVLQIHARADAQARSVAAPSPDADEGHPPRPHARPVRACTRIVPRLNSPSHDAAACIRDCVECIIANRPLACGLVCHFAPCVQSARVPYGHGDLVGTTFGVPHWEQGASIPGRSRSPVCGTGPWAPHDV